MGAHRGGQSERRGRARCRQCTYPLPSTRYPRHSPTTGIQWHLSSGGSAKRAASHPMEDVVKRRRAVGRQLARPSAVEARKKSASRRVGAARRQRSAIRCYTASEDGWWIHRNPPARRCSSSSVPRRAGPTTATPRPPPPPPLTAAADYAATTPPGRHHHPARPTALPLTPPPGRPPHRHALAPPPTPHRTPPGFRRRHHHLEPNRHRPASPCPRPLPPPPRRDGPRPAAHGASTAALPPQRHHHPARSWPYGTPCTYGLPCGARGPKFRAPARLRFLQILRRLVRQLPPLAAGLSQIRSSSLALKHVGHSQDCPNVCGCPRFHRAITRTDFVSFFAAVLVRASDRPTSSCSSVNLPCSSRLTNLLSLRSSDSSRSRATSPPERSSFRVQQHPTLHVVLATLRGRLSTTSATSTLERCSFARSHRGSSSANDTRRRSLRHLFKQPRARSTLMRFP